MFNKSTKQFIEKRQKLKGFFFFLCLFFNPCLQSSTFCSGELNIPCIPEITTIKFDNPGENILMHLREHQLPLDSECFFEVLARFAEIPNNRTARNFQQDNENIKPIKRIPLVDTEMTSKIKPHFYGLLCHNLVFNTGPLDEEDYQNPPRAFLIPDEKSEINTIIVNLDHARSTTTYFAHPEHIQTFLSQSGITYTGPTPTFYFSGSRNLFELRKFFQNVVNSDFLKEHIKVSKAEKSVFGESINQSKPSKRVDYEKLAHQKGIQILLDFDSGKNTTSKKEKRQHSFLTSDQTEIVNFVLEANGNASFTILISGHEMRIHRNVFKENKKKNENFDIYFTHLNGTKVDRKDLCGNSPIELKLVITGNMYSQIEKLKNSDWTPAARKIANSLIAKIGLEDAIKKGNLEIAIFLPQYQRVREEYDALSEQEKRKIKEFIGSIPKMTNDFLRVIKFRKGRDYATACQNYVIRDYEQMDYEDLLIEKGKEIYAKLRKEKIEDNSLAYKILALRDLASKNPCLYKESETYLRIVSIICDDFLKQYNNLNSELTKSAMEKFFKQMNIPEIFKEIEQFIPTEKILGSKNIQPIIEIVVQKILGL